MERQNKRLMFYIVIAFLLLTNTAWAPSFTAQSSTSGTLGGTVHNTHYQNAFPNAYVIVNDSTGFQSATTTDYDGRYSFELPYGSYSIVVRYLDEILENATNIQVGFNTTTTHDVYVSYSMQEDVSLSGILTSEENPAANQKVEVTVINTCYRNVTYSDEAGRYAISTPRGLYNISVYDGDELVSRTTHGPYTTPGPVVLDIEVSGTTESFTLSAFVDFLVENWYYLVALIGICIGLGVAYILIAMKLEKFNEGEGHRYSKEVMKILVFTVKVIYGLISLYIILTMIGYFWTQYSDETVSFLTMWSNTIIIIFILVLIARFLLLFIMNLMEKLKAQKQKSTDGVPLTAIMLMQVVFKYSIIGFFGFFIAIVLLSALGLYDMIISGFVDFFSNNMGSIVMMLAILVIAYLALRFTNSFMNDLKRRGTKYSPQMIKIIGSGVRFGVIFIFGLILLFTVLSMAGMQEMGTLIVVLATTMLGMIVAMAATGSIGNVLSGLILQSTKPYEKGQRVRIAGILGDVEEVALLFTRLRTLNNELVELPNNMVLASEMVNLSKSEVVAIEVNVSISYDIPVKVVNELLENGAKATKGILKDPKPFALVSDFDDYAVKYILRAYTDQPKFMPSTRSRLLANIQDTFYHAGVEILSPWYLVKREDAVPDGKQVSEKYQKMKLHKENKAKEGEETAYEGLKMFE